MQNRKKIFDELNHLSREEVITEIKKIFRLEDLFILWRVLDMRLAEIGKKDGDFGVTEEQECDILTDVQTIIMNTAALYRSKTNKDILFKIALWRWETANSTEELEQMDRSEALVYSAFRDLVEITSERTVMTEVDKTTNFMQLSTTQADTTDP